MALTWEEQMERLLPGPSPIKEKKDIQEAAIDSWDDKPFIFTVGGVEQEFFSIGQLGKALGNRSSNTLRAWERDGIIPKSPYTKPSATPQGKRRMYTRAMVEGMVQIAKEEGVSFPHKGIRLSDTQFQPRVLKLFQSLLKISR